MFSRISGNFKTYRRRITELLAMQWRSDTSTELFHVRVTI